jgi:hypothetical protein
LGDLFKGLKAGEVEKLDAEGNKLGERPGIAIAHVQYDMPDGLFLCSMVYNTGHLRKLKK